MTSNIFSMGTTSTTTNPFGVNNTASIAGANPFASPTPSSTNPFATPLAAPSTTTNPFATPTTNNPFSATNTTPTANPFATSTTNTNPFASNTTSTNPFSSTPSTSTSTNPFGTTSSTASPFSFSATATSSLNPFGTPMGVGTTPNNVPAVDPYLAVLPEEYKKFMNNGKFEAVVFNPMNKEDVNKEDQLYKDTIQNNPDPARFQPVKLQGVADFRQRLEKANAANKSHEEELHKIQNYLQILNEKIENQFCDLENCKQKNFDLLRDLLHISTTCDVMQGNTAVYQDRNYINKLNNIQSKLTNFDERILKLEAHSNKPDYQISSISLEKQNVQQIIEYLCDLLKGFKILESIVTENIEDMEELIERKNQASSQQ